MHLGLDAVILHELDRMEQGIGDALALKGDLYVTDQVGECGALEDARPFAWLG